MYGPATAAPLVVFLPEPHGHASFRPDLESVAPWDLLRGRNIPNVEISVETEMVAEATLFSDKPITAAHGTSV